MKFSVCRSKSRKRGEGVEMRQKTVMNDPFQNFRDEVQIGYWTIAGEVILRQRVLFESWKDQRMLEVLRNCGFLETEIDQMSNRTSRHDLISFVGRKSR